MKVLYMCFTDFNNINSGSSVRPYKLYTTFVEMGYEVLLINGVNAKTRRKKYLELKENKDLRDIDYCYIEPSTYPCHPLDYSIFLWIKKMKVPVGIFYRDMYYKFPELFQKTGFKNIELQVRYKIDWYIYKLIANTIFFPSDTMAKYFKFNRKVALPPAGEIHNIKKDLEKIHYRIIYVGGVSVEMGTKILLEALEKVNQIKSVALTLVCRDYNKNLFDKYKNSEWLEIKHLTNNQLIEEYEKVDFAIIPRPVNEYNNFAVPVKLFEYISYGMPIVTTNCFEITDFVEKNNIGIVLKDNSKDLADGIVYLYNNPDKIKEYAKSAKGALEKENLWSHRIEKIEEFLINKKM